MKLSNPYLLNGSLSAWVIPSTATGQYFYYSNNLGKSWTVTDTLKAGYILQLAPVTPTATWLMMVGNARNPAQSTNVIAYRDIAGSWKYIDTLKRSGSFGSAFTITDLQFIDPYHGWVSATFSSVDSIFFYRYKAPVPVIGVSVQNSQATLRCVPNPARSVVSIEGLSPDEVVESIYIINTNGVEHEPALEMSNSHISVRVNDLANGTYVVNVRTSKRKESISMIVLR